VRADPSLAQVFEASGDPAFVIDPFEDEIVAANPAGCAMLGYTREELLATPVSGIHPAELAQLQEFLERVLEDGQGSTIGLTCRTKSGFYLPTEMALSALESSGSVYILGLVRDRSEHRQPAPR
jgi:chemotaxis family two-component system sensor kinase Cph1